MLCSPMAKRRGGVGVAACNGFMYAVGGHDAPASNPASSRFDCVERYGHFHVLVSPPGLLVIVLFEPLLGYCSCPSCCQQ